MLVKEFLVSVVTNEQLATGSCIIGKLTLDHQGHCPDIKGKWWGLREPILVYGVGDSVDSKTTPHIIRLNPLAWAKDVDGADKCTVNFNEDLIVSHAKVHPSMTRLYYDFFENPEKYSFTAPTADVINDIVSSEFKPTPTKTTIKEQIKEPVDKVVKAVKRKKPKTAKKTTKKTSK